MNKLIGISGRMHTGKTTIANYLVEDGFEKWSFATKVREVADTLGLAHTRANLQKLGHGLRAIWPDVWVDALRIDLESTVDLKKKVVFDDVRYPNEVKLIQRLGGVVIRLEANEETRWSRYLTSDKFDPDLPLYLWKEQQRNGSEIALDGFKKSDYDFVVDVTDVDLEDMYKIGEKALLLKPTTWRIDNDRR